ncbi:MAG: L-seryl-tRNA(Sec) selenium transferase [Planctomycetota bacterium]
MTLFRQLPSLDRLLGEPWAQRLMASSGREALAAACRSALEASREAIARLGAAWQAPSWEEAVRAALHTTEVHRTRRAVNATGVLLHTGLGRAVLPSKAVNALSRGLGGATQLEIDPVSGQRSRREDASAALLSAIFGCEDALVVNNNAAATLLVLHALAAGKDVVISRGELVEIGGSFRLPEIMKQSQATLNEVGCTNRTHLSDFKSAITDRTGLLMKAHASNYKLVGFVDEVPLAALVSLGREMKLPVVHDIGSGAPRDLGAFGLKEEPLPSRSLKEGADLVFFSGDKLLGGPQCGIILGSKRYVDLCRKNPLARALRVGKLTLLALEATLILIREGHWDHIPLYARLMKSPEELKAEAEALSAAIASRSALWTVAVEPSPGQMGSGSTPAVELPSFRVTLQRSGFNADQIAARLRSKDIPVYGHIHDGLFGLNVLSMVPEDAVHVLEALGD